MIGLLAMQGSNSWLIQALDNTTGQYTYQNWTTQASWPQYNWVQAGVLELPSISNCNQLPVDNQIYFSIDHIDEFYSTWDTVLDVTNSLSWQSTNDGLTPNCNWSPSFVSIHNAALLRWTE